MQSTHGSITAAQYLEAAKSASEAMQGHEAKKPNAKPFLTIRKKHAETTQDIAAQIEQFKLILDIKAELESEIKTMGDIFGKFRACIDQCRKSIHFMFVYLRCCEGVIKELKLVTDKKYLEKLIILHDKLDDWSAAIEAIIPWPVEIDELDILWRKKFRESSIEFFVKFFIQEKNDPFSSSLELLIRKIHGQIQWINEIEKHLIVYDEVFVQKMEPFNFDVKTLTITAGAKGIKIGKNEKVLFSRSAARSVAGSTSAVDIKVGASTIGGITPMSRVLGMAGKVIRSSAHTFDRSKVESLLKDRSKLLDHVLEVFAYTFSLLKTQSRFQRFIYLFSKLKKFNVRLDWTTRANKGDIFAQYQLAVRYEIGGELIQKDEKQALQWYRRAAEGGCVAAQLYLAECYRDGKPGLVDKDEAEAFDWYLTAADEDDDVAQQEVVRCFEDGHLGIVQSQVCADYWRSRMGAKENDRHAQFELARCYDTGHGVDQDEKRALFWYKKAALQNHSDAQVKLGLDLSARGLKQDEKQVYSLFRKAAAQEHPIALYCVGECFELGYGVEKDEKEALNWYGKAASKGNHGAKDILNKKLFLAAQRNQVELMRSILTLGADANAVNEDKKSAFELAYANRAWHSAIFLAMYLEQIKKPNPHYLTLISFSSAIARNNRELISALLSVKDPLDEKTEQGDVIAWAAQQLMKLPIVLYIARKYKKTQDGNKGLAVYACIAREIDTGKFQEGLSQILETNRNDLLQVSIEQDYAQCLKILLNNIPNARRLIEDILMRQAIDQDALKILAMVVADFDIDPAKIRIEGMTAILYAIIQQGGKDQKDGPAATLIASTIRKRMLDPRSSLKITSENKQTMVRGGNEQKNEPAENILEAKDVVEKIDTLLATSSALNSSEYKECFAAAREMLSLASDKKSTSVGRAAAYTDEKVIRIYENLDKAAEREDLTRQDYRIALAAAHTKQKLLLTKRHIETTRSDVVDSFLTRAVDFVDEKSFVPPRASTPSSKRVVSDNKNTQVFIANIQKMKLLSYFSDKLKIVDSVLSFALKLQQISQQGICYDNLEILVDELIEITNQLGLFNTSKDNWLYLLRALLRKDHITPEEEQVAKKLFPQDHVKFSALLKIKRKLWQFSEEKMDRRILADCVEPICQLFDMTIDPQQPSLMNGLLLMLQGREQEAITCFFMYIQKETQTHYAALGGLSTLAMFLLCHKFSANVYLTSGQIVATYFNHMDAQTQSDMKAFFEVIREIDGSLHKAQRVFQEQDEDKACHEVVAGLIVVAKYYQVNITEADKALLLADVKKYFPFASLKGHDLSLSHQYPLLVLFSHFVKATHPPLAQKILCYAEIIRGMSRLEATHVNAQRLQILLEVGCKIARIQNSPRLATLLSSIGLAWQIYQSLQSGNIDHEKLTIALTAFKARQNSSEVNVVIGIALAIQSLYKITNHWQSQLTTVELIEKTLTELVSLAEHYELIELTYWMNFGIRVFNLYRSLTANEIDHVAVLRSCKDMESLVDVSYQPILRSLSSIFFAMYTIRKMSPGTDERFALLVQGVSGCAVIWENHGLTIGSVLAEHLLRAYEKTAKAGGGYEQMFKPMLLALNDARAALNNLDNKKLVDLRQSELYQLIDVSGVVVQQGAVIADVYNQVKELAGVASALGFDTKILTRCLGAESDQVKTLQKVLGAFNSGDAKEMQSLLPAAQQQFTGAQVAPANAAGSSSSSFFSKALSNVSSFLPLANLAVSCIGAYYAYKSTKQLEKVLEILPEMQKQMGNIAEGVEACRKTLETMQKDMHLYFKQVLTGMQQLAEAANTILQNIEVAAKRLEEAIFSSTKQVITRVELLVKIMEVNFNSMHSENRELSIELNALIQHDRFHHLEKELMQIRSKLKYGLSVKPFEELLFEILSVLTDEAGVRDSIYNGVSFSKDDIYSKFKDGNLENYLISFLGKLFSKNEMPNLYYLVKCCNYLNRLLKKHANNRLHQEAFLQHVEMYQDVINYVIQVIDFLSFANVRDLIVSLLTQLQDKYDENILIRIKLIAAICNIPIEHLGESGFALWDADNKPENKAQLEKLIIHVFKSMEPQVVNQSPYILLLKNIRDELIRTGLQMLGVEYVGQIQSHDHKVFPDFKLAHALPASSASALQPLVTPAIRLSPQFAFVKVSNQRSQPAGSIDVKISEHLMGASTFFAPRHSLLSDDSKLSATAGTMVVSRDTRTVGVAEHVVTRVLDYPGSFFAGQSAAAPLVASASQNNAIVLFRIAMDLRISHQDLELFNRLMAPCLAQTNQGPSAAPKNDGPAS